LLYVATTDPVSVIALFGPTEITVMGTTFPLAAGEEDAAGDAPTAGSAELGADCPPPHAAKVAENAATAANLKNVRNEVIPRSNLGMTSPRLNLRV
jgi:hypothetical protein